jgi:transcriptional regulator of acetoin/glycerol metabolism
MTQGDLARIGTREYARDVARSWDRLLADYDDGKPAVRDVVFESWLRCKQIGVDPLKRAAPTAGAPAARPDFAGGERLRRVVRASLDPVASRLSDVGSVLFGTDETGRIFFAKGDPRLSETLAENSVVAGGLWDEGKIGTNAIGTALALGQGVLIHGDEHFCQAGKPWSCAADVFRDPVDGSVLGVIDVTGPAREVSLRAGALISAVVERIESELSRQNLMDQIALIDRFDAEAGGSDGLVIVDRRGLVVRSRVPQAIAPGVRQGAHLPGLNGLPWNSWTLDLTHEGLRDGELDWITSGDEVIGAAIHLPRPRPRAAAPNDLPRPYGATPNDLPRPLQNLLQSIPSQAETIRAASIVAKSDVAVLVTGETGTGKDILANAIHLSGPRAEKPFVSVNCAAIPRDLIGVELFGYVEGAFTGTRRGGRAGRIEDADGGTLFLDEIGDMPLELQPYLLRVVESGALSRLGESRQRRVNVRVIAATNQPVETLMDQQRFRPDLYYRLNVARLHIPPLRERPEDIAPLVARIAAQIHKGEGGNPIDRAFIDALMTEELPGNIRELQAKVHRHVVGLTPKAVPAGAPPAPKEDKVARIERSLILDALARHRDNVAKVAAELSMPRSTLYRKIALYRSQGLLSR